MTSLSTNREEAVQVAVRIRGLISRERRDKREIKWEASENTVVSSLIDAKQRKYRFDRVFESSDTNRDVYESLCRDIIDSAVRGFNCTIFAYGQTSSGKTYTMMGDERDPGIIPSAIDQIFDSIDVTRNRQYLLRVSYLEIYNENVMDLLSPDRKRTSLTVMEDGDGNVIVDGAREETVTSPDDVMRCLMYGERFRHIGETNMNERSSRSHTIFRLTIESSGDEDEEDGAIMVSHLNLVDLAGSERASQTGASGERLREGGNINKSLLVLSQVISKLSDGSVDHLPIRNSKLTRILKNSLGGNARTAIICTVTPVEKEQTKSTLEFASRAKNVVQHAHINEVLDDQAMLKRMKKEILALQKKVDEGRFAEEVVELQQLKGVLEEKDRKVAELEEKLRFLRENVLSGPHNDPTTNIDNRRNRRETWGGMRRRRMSFFPTSSLRKLSDSEADFFEEKEPIYSRENKSFTESDRYISDFDDGAYVSNPVLSMGNVTTKRNKQKKVKFFSPLDEENDSSVSEERFDFDQGLCEKDVPPDELCEINALKKELHELKDHNTFLQNRVEEMQRIEEEKEDLLKDLKAKENIITSLKQEKLDNPAQIVDNSSSIKSPDSYRLPFGEITMSAIEELTSKVELLQNYATELEEEVKFNKEGHTDKDEELKLLKKKLLELEREDNTCLKTQLENLKFDNAQKEQELQCLKKELLDQEKRMENLKIEHEINNKENSIRKEESNSLREGLLQEKNVLVDNSQNMACNPLKKELECIKMDYELKEKEWKNELRDQKQIIENLINSHDREIKSYEIKYSKELESVRSRLHEMEENAKMEDHQKTSQTASNRLEILQTELECFKVKEKDYIEKEKELSSVKNELLEQEKIIENLINLKHSHKQELEEKNEELLKREEELKLVKAKLSEGIIRSDSVNASQNSQVETLMTEINHLKLDNALKEEMNVKKEDELQSVKMELLHREKNMETLINELQISHDQEMKIAKEEKEKEIKMWESKIREVEKEKDDLISEVQELKITCDRLESLQTEFDCLNVDYKQLENVKIEMEKGMKNELLNQEQVIEDLINSHELELKRNKDEKSKKEKELDVLKSRLIEIEENRDDLSINYRNSQVTLEELKAEFECIKMDHELKEKEWKNELRDQKQIIENLINSHDREMKSHEMKHSKELESVRSRLHEMEENAKMEDHQKSSQTASNRLETLQTELECFKVKERDYIDCKEKELCSLKNKLFEQEKLIKDFTDAKDSYDREMEVNKEERVKTEKETQLLQAKLLEFKSSQDCQVETLKTELKRLEVDYELKEKENIEKDEELQSLRRDLSNLKHVVEENSIHDIARRDQDLKVNDLDISNQFNESETSYVKEITLLLKQLQNKESVLASLQQMKRIVTQNLEDKSKSDLPINDDDSLAEELSADFKCMKKRLQDLENEKMVTDKGMFDLRNEIQCGLKMLEEERTKVKNLTSQIEEIKQESAKDIKTMKEEVRERTKLISDLEKVLEEKDSKISILTVAKRKLEFQSIKGTMSEEKIQDDEMKKLKTKVEYYEEEIARLKEIRQKEVPTPAQLESGGIMADLTINIKEHEIKRLKKEIEARKAHEEKIMLNYRKWKTVALERQEEIDKLTKKSEEGSE